MAILEHIRDITIYRLYANGCPKCSLSNRGCGTAGIVLRVEILNFQKNRFLAKNI